MSHIKISRKNFLFKSKNIFTAKDSKEISNKNRKFKSLQNVKFY